MHLLTRRLEDCARKGDRRTFSIGAGDMDHRRQPPLGMIERGQKPLDAIKRQIDPPRVKRKQPCRHSVDRSGFGPRSTHAGAGRLTGGGGATAGAAAGEGGAFINMRHRRATVARRSWRCTTMSTMPCSRRYSAR